MLLLNPLLTGVGASIERFRSVHRLRGQDVGLGVWKDLEPGQKYRLTLPLQTGLSCCVL